MKLPVLNNERPEVCTTCGGKCCQNAPGGYFPSDFGDTEAEIRAGVQAALLGGTAALSGYDEEPFVHPPIQGYEGIVQEVAVVSPFARLTGVYPKSPCANLTPAGCSLEFDRRPTQCRVLVPDPEGKVCRLPSSVSDEACREAWAPFLDLFNDLR